MVFFNPAQEIVYGVLTPFINVDEDKTILYDYLVYGTGRRMDEGYVIDVPEIIDKLKDRGEGIIIKEKGDSYKKTQYDYIFMRDEDVPELNIEIYIAKNVEFPFGSFPFRTSELFLENIVEKFLIYSSFCVFLILYGVCTKLIIR